jgi:NAD(P)H dehydrogenase (quinone)
MYVVAGVSGNTGSVVASTLLDGKEKVRVVVRDRAKGMHWAARGAEMAVAELNDPEALARAFAGAKGAYVLVPPQNASTSVLADNAKVVDAIVAAAKASMIPHVVLLSSLGAHLPGGTGTVRSLHDAESKLFTLGLAVTAVRAGSFYENNAAALGAATGGGVFPTFLRKDIILPWVGAKDIGRAAARALLQGPRGIEVIELSGPRDLSPTDIARALGKLLGKELQIQEAPDAAIVPAMTGFGLSQDMAELYRELYHGLNAGTTRFEGGKARQMRGEVSIEDYLREALGRRAPAAG